MKRWTDVVSCLACVAVLVVLVAIGYVRYQEVLAAGIRPVPSCVSLYRMAHTSTDSLYVAVNRGDCAK